MKELPFTDSDLNTLVSGGWFNLGRPLGWKNVSFLLFASIVVVFISAGFFQLNEPSLGDYWQDLKFSGLITFFLLIYTSSKVMDTDNDYKEKIKVQFTAKVKKMNIFKIFRKYSYSINLYENPYTERKLTLLCKYIKTVPIENQEYIFEVAKKSRMVLSITPVQNSDSEK